MRILFWSHESGGCAWYRSHEPRRVMALLGHQVDRTAEINPRMRLPDVLHAQRLYDQQNLLLWKALKTDGRCGLVYDLDDDLFNVPKWSPAHQVYGLPEVQHGISGHLAAADVVTVSTRTLIDVVRQHTDAPIALIQNTVPAALLELDSTAGASRTVGWSGSDTHSGDWRPSVVSAVRRATHKDSALTIMGAQFPFADNHIPWQPYIWDYYSALRQFAIGLAPLASNKFNKSKSHIKVLEYMALGIPYVASQEEPYLHIDPDGVAGFLIPHGTPRMWDDRISRLRSDTALYGAMSLSGKQVAARNTTEHNAKAIEQALLLAVKDKAHGNTTQ